MRRGDLVLTVGRGDLSTRPRPSLVVQADAFTAFHPSLTVCPVTTRLSGPGFFRVPIAANDRSGLIQDSEVEIDLLQAIRRERTLDVIGSAPEEVMTAVDHALRRWLSI